MAEQVRATPPQVAAKASGIHAVHFLVFVVFVIPGVVSYLRGGPDALMWIIGGIVVGLLAAASFRIAEQWEKVVILRLGRFKGTAGPGVVGVVPFIDSARPIDLRVQASDIPHQEVMTKDNVPVAINGVLYFNVVRADDALIKVQDFRQAISLFAQTALRDVVGGLTLDELLAEREMVGDEIEKIVEKAATSWGLDVTAIKIQDISMPEELKKMMSRQASAEREKRANITKAEGDKLAALNLAEAASTMRASPGAMQLRTLQSVDGLGPTASNTVVLALPLELFELAAWLAKKPAEPD
jgi:regulator of protease activity HflC (stomatin/prohibitin superfamily)